MPTQFEFQSQPARSALWLCLSLSVSVPAFAQNLQNLPGLSEIQRPVAAAVQSACGSLSTKATRTPDEQKLFESCRKMVQSANALAGAGASAQSLGLSNEQLREAVQAVGHEEVAIQGRSSIETAGSNPVGLRLFSLRNGARGFGVSNAGDYGTTQRSAAAAGSRQPETGGGAATEPTGRLGGFLNLNYNAGDKSTTAREDGFDFDNRGITTGLDYRFNDNLVAGIALSYAETNATIFASLGNADSKSAAFSAYGTWYVDKFHVDSHLSYSRNEYDTTRNIVVPSRTSVPGFSTAAVGSTKGNQVAAVIGAGYDIDRGSLLISPFGRVGYLKLKIDAYRESEPNHGLALDVNSQTLTSLQSALGLKLAFTASTPTGVVVPFVSAEWNHEFENDTRSLTAKYTHDPFNNFFAIPTDVPDRTYFTLSAGVSALFKNGLSAFLTVSSVERLKDVKNRGAVVGLRKEF